MEDHYDKVLEHVAKAHSSYAQALKDLLGAVETVGATVDNHASSRNANPDATRKTIKQLKALLDEIIDRSERHDEEKLLKRAKAARSSLAEFAQRVKSKAVKSTEESVAGAERRQKSSAGSEREKVLQKEEGGGVKKSVEEKEKEKEKEKKGDKKKQKAIAMSVLSMQSLEELISLAKRCSDKTDNLINILKRLKKTQVSAEKLKQTGAGKYVAGLKKHENPQVAALAKGVVSIWKESVKAASKSASEKETGASSSSQAQGKKEVSKFAKLTSKEIRRQQEAEKKKPKRRMDDPELVRAKQKKRREVQQQPLSQEEWERQYLNRARQGYEKYQEEENYSAYVGKQDDLRALQEDGY